MQVYEECCSLGFWEREGSGLRNGHSLALKAARTVQKYFQIMSRLWKARLVCANKDGFA